VALSDCNSYQAQVDRPKLELPGGKKRFLKRCTDQFDRLYLEGAENARVMAISIHPTSPACRTASNIWKRCSTTSLAMTALR
jgi:hypothetical protein